jgi:hypothetical protein
VPWESNRTQVISADGSVRDVETPTGDACLEVEFVECAQPQKTCRGAAADLVLDEDGKVLETVCYPESGTLDVAAIEAQDGNVRQNQNNAVIVLDGAPAVDIEGNLSVDANNVVIYGDSPDAAVIGGDLGVDGNNMIVRGVRIQGDANIAANNSVLLHCVIEGDLHVTGNNSVVTGCDVFGKVTIEGNNTRFSGNRVGLTLHDSGKNTRCDANLAVQDENGDLVFADAEPSSELGCGR